MYIKTILASFCLLFVLLFVPTETRAQSPSLEAEYRSLLIELIESLKKQVLLLQIELADREEEGKVRVADDSFLNSVRVLDSYTINAPRTTNFIEDSEQRTYFNRVLNLFPENFESKLEQLVVFVGGEIDLDAFVESLPPKHDAWLYATNQEIINGYSSEDTDMLIIHELAHIVSYENVPGVPEPTIIRCDEYFKNSYGCPDRSSYLQQFVNEFWSSSDLSRAGLLVGSNDLFEDSSDYYRSHEENFVSDYAAVSPEEDFSETFMFYVLNRKTEKSSEASAKVNFLSKYQELVGYKKEIRNSL